MKQLHEEFARDLYHTVTTFLRENPNNTTVGTAIRYFRLFPPEFEIMQVAGLTQLAQLGMKVGAFEDDD